MIVVAIVVVIFVPIIVDNDRDKDSNATNGWTFRAKVGSFNKGHNINWIFTPASGTVFLFR